MKESESTREDTYRKDCELFSSLLKRIVRAEHDDDPSDEVLEAVGRNVGADRCYVFWFWEPGKSSMCTNTHEWNAEGIKSEISGQQTINLADFAGFNVCITSGRDFLFTDIAAIDAGLRDWLESQGIKSLVATPIVGAGGLVLGFVGFDFVSGPCAEITDRIVFNIHEMADLLLNCQKLHERDMAMTDILPVESKDDGEEMQQQQKKKKKKGKTESEFEAEFENSMAILQADVHTMSPHQMLEVVRNRMDADICYLIQDIHTDGSGTVFPKHAVTRDGWMNDKSWTLSTEFGRAIDARFRASFIVTLRESEIAWLKACTSRDEQLPASARSMHTAHVIGIRREGKVVGLLCVGYARRHALVSLQAGFLRRASMIIVAALEKIETYRQLAVSLKITNLKSDVIEYMFKHRDYARIREYIGRKVCAISGAQHLMLCSSDGTRADWLGRDAPKRCHDCVKSSCAHMKQLPDEFFAESETVIVSEGDPRPDMNLPPHCPLLSSVVCQFKKGDGWWRLVADYTKTNDYNLAEVARGLRVALELLVISCDRELHEKTIASMQEHQRFRADTLAYALSKDDIPGLIDLTLHRLLDLTECDYIALHSVDGDHLMLHPGGELRTCPERCGKCSFYGLDIPPEAENDKVIELNDAKGQTFARLPSECPAKSLAVAVVPFEGKPWGGIALHYLNRQKEISQDDRQTLEIAANVLALALERHSAAARLESERDRAVAAEKARSYFFSTVSHDIRTPLNVIIGFSELLESGDVPPEEAKHNLKMIVSSGKTLLQLVNDILDLSRMDVGKLEFNFEPTDVGEIVRELVQVFTPMSVQKSQSIVTEIADMPHLNVDPHRFRQVLFNFLGNAVKYAGPCTIRVSVAYADGLMRLTVADNGKGVPAEKAKRLMQPFVQADIKNRTEGSGLGLAICKRLLEIVHGTISIDTAPGKGFVIHAEIPVEVASGDEKVANEVHVTEVAPLALPKRILVVDDLPANRAVIKAILKKMGITDVELAEDGRAALDKLEKDSDFDLVLTDMWMPIMDGAELIRRIRADGRLSKLKVCAMVKELLEGNA